MNKWNLAAVALVALMFGTAVYAASVPRTTIVLKFFQGGCLILDNGHNATNGTLTFFDVLPTVGTVVTHTYTVENFAKGNATLNGIAVATGPELSGTVSGINFPLTLQPSVPSPFTVTLAVLTVPVQGNSTAVITANCA